MSMSLWVDVNGWPVPPTVLLGCLVIEGLYFRGWNVLVKSKSVQETAGKMVLPAASHPDTAAQLPSNWYWRGAFFHIAILVFLLGSSAPIDILSGRYFWVHMVQHLLILVVMAPLLVAGTPLLPLWLGLPAWGRAFGRSCARTKLGRACVQVGHGLRQPATSCVILIIGIWLWHWPTLYDLALTNEFIHDWGEHLTFLLVSLLFWSQVIPSHPLALRTSVLGRAGCVGIAILQNVVLAVLLGFAPTPLYAPYAHLGTNLLAGLTPLQDQQIGAGIMWTAGDVPFTIALSLLLQRWLAGQLDADPSPATTTGGVPAGKEQSG